MLAQRVPAIVLTARGGACSTGRGMAVPGHHRGQAGEQEAALLRFRSNQLHRAARAAAECEDPAEAATLHLDFALAGFADHALIDRVADGSAADGEGRIRLVRAAETPSGTPGPSMLAGKAGLPARYAEGHPALQCVARSGSVRAGAGDVGPEEARAWAQARQWPPDAVHALCTVLRSRGRTLGVVTFLRGAGRSRFERPDAVYGETSRCGSPRRSTWRTCRAPPRRRSPRRRPDPNDRPSALSVEVRSPYSRMTRAFQSWPPSTFPDRSSGGSTPRSERTPAAVAITAWSRAVVTTVEAGAKGAGMASRVSVRVAHCDLGVEDDVAVVLEVGARGVPRAGLRGVRHRGDPDDLAPVHGRSSPSPPGERCGRTGR